MSTTTILLVIAAIAVVALIAYFATRGAGSDAVGVTAGDANDDPALSASQPAAELAQSAGNALGHALEGPTTPLGNPVAAFAALHAARRTSTT